MEAPEPIDVIDLRVTANMTQQQAATLMHVSLRTWQGWEWREREMPWAYLTLFLLLTRQTTLATIWSTGIPGPR